MLLILSIVKIVVAERKGLDFSLPFDLCIYTYIYIKFTEASHHNTLNMTQNRWM